jgi:hypothetical protein
MFIQTSITRLKPLYDRFIVRDHLISGAIKKFAPNGNLPMTVWFNLEFWKSLTFSQFVGLLSLASFKVVTFPLGVWIGSFSLVQTYPLANLLGNVFALFTHPIFLFLAWKGLGEFVVNSKTMLGFGVVMVSLVTSAVGWYLIYVGGNTA